LALHRSWTDSRRPTTLAKPAVDTPGRLASRARRRGPAAQHGSGHRPGRAQNDGATITDQRGTRDVPWSTQPVLANPRRRPLIPSDYPPTWYGQSGRRGPRQGLRGASGRGGASSAVDQPRCHGPAWTGLPGPSRSVGPAWTKPVRWSSTAWTKPPGWSGRLDPPRRISAGSASLATAVSEPAMRRRRKHQVKPALRLLVHRRT
jgi:hypothetical protein